DMTFSEARMDGNGFGLGWAVTVDSVETMQPGSVGSYSWGGLASTFFWIDPEEELIAIQATQMIPSNAYPLRPQFQQLVYAAIDW
ncbi:MAG: serine hydrolase, partial [Pseudomonadota bacterium]